MTPQKTTPWRKTARTLNLTLITLASMTLAGCATSAVTVTQHTEGAADDVYQRFTKALDDEGFVVLFEPNLGKSLGRFFPKKFAATGIDAMRAVIFCSGSYAVKVLTVDTDVAGLCPLHATVITEAGKTRILFVKPSTIAPDSPARALLEELEAKVVKALEKASR